jgi:hypothetical protein
MNTSTGFCRLPATAPKVSKAAYFILTASDNRNPYEISEHLAIHRGNLADCDEPELWLSDNQLVPRTELADSIFFCPACEYEYSLWETLLEQAAINGNRVSTEYGDRVFTALALEDELKDGYITLADITAEELDDLKAVRTERRKIEALKAWEQAEEARAARSKQHR